MSEVVLLAWGSLVAREFDGAGLVLGVSFLLYVLAALGVWRLLRESR